MKKLKVPKLKAALMYKGVAVDPKLKKTELTAFLARELRGNCCSTYSASFVAGPSAEVEPTAADFVYSSDDAGTPRLSVVRRARSGRTVRQMTTSVHVLELHTSALGHKAYVNSIPVQKVGGSGEISQKITPLDHSLNTSRGRPVLQAPDGPCLGGQRARARPAQVLKLCMCPLWVPDSPEPLCRWAYLRPSFKKFRLR